MGRPKKETKVPTEGSNKAGITHTSIKQRTGVNPYEELANGIILQAAKDYETALKKLLKRPQDKDAMGAAISLEHFFHSAWFSVLSAADPDFIIDGLRAKVRNQAKKKKQSENKA